MTAFLNHLYNEFRTGIRNKQMLFVHYLFPLAFYVMMGFVMVDINPTFRTSLVPAMAVLAVLFATLMGIPDPLVKAREDGILRSYRINGVPTTSILAIPSLTATLHLLVVTLLIWLSAGVLFDAPLPVNGLAFIGTLLAITFASAGMGTLIGVLAPSTTVTILLAQAIFLPSMLLSGMMVPLSMFSGPIAAIARLLPASHAMNAFNALAMGYSSDFNPIGSLLMLLVSGLVSFLLAHVFYNWDRRNTRNQGHPLFALLPLLPFLMGLFI